MVKLGPNLEQKDNYPTETWIKDIKKKFIEGKMQTYMLRYLTSLGKKMQDKIFFLYVYLDLSNRGSSMIKLRYLGFPSGSDGKLPAMQETQVQSQGQDVTWKREGHPTPVFLSGDSHGQRRLVGYSPWGSHRVRHHWSDLSRTLHIRRVLLKTL